MSESMRMWVEIAFNSLYLIVVWGLVVMMIVRRRVVSADDQSVNQLVIVAFTLLALGDTGHVGFRLIAYAIGDLEATFPFLGMQTSWVGLGALATAYTVTIFYILVLFIWKERFDQPIGWFGYLLIGAAIFRLIYMASPANQWNRVVPLQPYSTYRNLPLMLQGLGAAFLILRDAFHNNDKTFRNIGYAILVSYTCYMPVIFWIQQVPMLGMLMIPKTIAYVAIAIIAYRTFYRADPVEPRVLKPA